MEQTIQHTNRISHLQNENTNRCNPERRLKKDVQAMLHEIAFVLHCTRRVKAGLVEDIRIAE